MQDQVLQIMHGAGDTVLCLFLKSYFVFIPLVSSHKGLALGHSPQGHGYQLLSVITLRIYTLTKQSIIKKNPDIKVIASRPS